MLPVDFELHQVCPRCDSRTPVLVLNLDGEVGELAWWATVFAQNVLAGSFMVEREPIKRDVMRIPKDPGVTIFLRVAAQDPVNCSAHFQRTTEMVLALHGVRRLPAGAFLAAVAHQKDLVSQLVIPAGQCAATAVLRHAGSSAEDVAAVTRAAFPTGLCAVEGSGGIWAAGWTGGGARLKMAVLWTSDV